MNNGVAEFVEKVGVNAYHFYFKTKKKFVIASRDFAMNVLLNVEPDGSVYFLASTDNCQAGIPSKPNAIRAESPISAWYIQPVAGEASRSVVYCINEVDIKGSIPEFAFRQAQKDQGY